LNNFTLTVENIVVKEADLIFQGKVNALNYVLAANAHGKYMIYTDLSLGVDDLLRGQIDKETPFPFRTIGGVYQDKTLEVKGMPDFSSDESFILFLKKQGEGYSFVRGEMGKVSISGTRPTITEKSKWNGLSPVVKYSINPNISCQNAVMSGGNAEIFFSANFDSDCTGNSCVFLWKCGNTIVQSDVQLNSVATRWTLLAPTDSSETNLQSELLHDFGHIAGIEHCKIGDTQSMCTARLGSFWEDFKQTDVMYRFTPYLEKIAANDIQAIQTLYGTLNLPFPTDGKYALNEEDIGDVIGQIEMEAIVGVNSVENRKQYGNYVANLTRYSQRRTGQSLRQQYDDFFDLAKRQTAGFSIEQLRFQLQYLNMGIYNGYRLKEDTGLGYNTLDPTLLEYMLQKHLELRQSTIDAIGR